MKIAALAILLFTLAPLRAVDYPLTEDSKAHDGVPKGEVLKRTFSDSSIFPGTTRSVSIYVPKQYDSAKPACVWVNQDGIQHNAPLVFDNLIAKGEMPVTIYVAASPGVVKALDGKLALDRFNRSLEYDGLGDAYGRFVLEELLPFVEKQKTADGREIVLSKNGNDRCIGGSSSGAVCAFTAAWEKPDAFRRVFSTIGTYVGLRGADVYPTLIRKMEPKPLRVFLQDGSADQNIYGGDWWMANQMMERALTFAGYEVNHVWGEEGHNAKQGDAIFPDAVRWLWKDWPKEPKAGTPKSGMLPEIVLPEEKWEVVWKRETPKDEDREAYFSLAANAQGEVVFSAEGTEFKIDKDGKRDKLSTHLGFGAAFGPDGRLYTSTSDDLDGDLVAYAADGSETNSIAKERGGERFVVRSDGAVFLLTSVVDSQTESGYDDRIWYISPKGRVSLAVTPPPYTNGFAFSADQSLLYVGLVDRVLSYQIQPDGSLVHPQEYFNLQNGPNGTIEAEGLAVDRDGRLYVGTTLGVQICDQAGRVNAILLVPATGIHNLCFGGPEFDTLYVLANDTLLRRKLKIKGAPACLPPVLPKAPHL